MDKSDKSNYKIDSKFQNEKGLINYLNIAMVLETATSGRTAILFSKLNF